MGARVQIRIGEKEALDTTLQFFEERFGRLSRLEFYQERRLKGLGLLDEDGRSVSLTSCTLSLASQAEPFLPKLTSLARTAQECSLRQGVQGSCPWVSRLHENLGFAAIQRLELKKPGCD